jgi:phosphomannomutase
MIDPKNFKAYDIRGVYPTTLNEEISYKIGRAYAKFLQEETSKTDLNIVVSSDMRLSGPSLKKALIDGLIDSGINVIEIGLTSTPSFYFAVAEDLTATFLLCIPESSL